jgi:hypothetical protein
MAAEPVDVPARDDELLRLSSVEVEASRTPEYRATNSMSATRMFEPLPEVPFDVAILTEDLIIVSASFGGDGDVRVSGGADMRAPGFRANLNVQSMRDQVRETNRFDRRSCLDARPSASVGFSYAWKMPGVVSCITAHARNLLTTQRASRYLSGAPRGLLSRQHRT